MILTSDGLLYRVTKGSDVLMDCEVFGSPRPHITWSDTHTHTQTVLAVSPSLLFLNQEDFIVHAESYCGT